MRITKLSIKNYKNLQDFVWELNADYPVAVIVGKNGSGKTNLLEAIITIFQDLQLYDHESKTKSLPKFEFEIEYLNLDDTINIKNDSTLKITKTYNKSEYFKENDDKVAEQVKIGNEKVIKQLEQIDRLRKANEKDLPKVKIDEIVTENVPLSRLQNFRQDISQGEDILPKSIFVYYAGNTTRLAELTDKSISAYKQTLIDIANNKIERQYSPKQPLFYYDLIHHQAVFLTLMLSGLKNIQDEFLKNDLGIEELSRVSLEISRPEWKRTSTDRKKISTDTDSFGDAPNYLKRILEIFNEAKNFGVEEVDTKRLGLFIDGEKLKEIFAETSDEKEFFQQLSNLILADYLTDIRIYFEKDGVEQLEFADLSEGEWQRIAIRGAMELFQGEETLFLLDEPDTFAHPRWQWEFVPDIEKTVGNDKENKSTQVVFITHSPLVLSSTEKNAFFMEAGKIHLLHENFAQDANMSLAKMGVNPQFEKFGDDFENYFELIKNGKGETEVGLAERTRLEEIYGLNHEKFDTADIMISFYR